MIDHLSYNLCKDGTYRIRCMRGLLIQIKKDHKDLIYLWERLRGVKKVNFEIDEILKRISWIKESIAFFEDFKNSEIEGISLLETKGIENDLVIKENLLREIIRNVSLEEGI
jgi:hypothetical protein